MGGQPKVPDAKETAEWDFNAGRFAATQNVWNQNFNEENPYGNKTVRQTGSVKIYDPFTRQYIDQPTYTQRVTLSPGEQSILDKNTQMRGNIGDIGVQQSARLLDHLGRPINTEGLQTWNAGPQAPGLATGFGDAGPIQTSLAGQAVRQDATPTDRAAVEQAMLDRYERQAAPRNQAQEVQMAARGMSPGGQGYGEMQDAQGRERTEMQTNAFLASGQESRAAQEAYNQAAQQRFGQGAAQGAFANAAQMQQYQQMLQRAGFSNEAIQQMFNMGGAAADRGNALRQSQWGERLSERNQPINEIMALLGGAGVNNTQIQPYQGSQVAAVPVGQRIYDQYNAESEAAANKMQGYASIASGVLGMLPFSDRRAKTDIKPIGGNLAGAPLYTYRLWTDMDTLLIGVMADEVKLLHPDAVHMDVDGLDHVDYEMLNRRHVA